MQHCIVLLEVLALLCYCGPDCARKTISDEAHNILKNTIFSLMRKHALPTENRKLVNVCSQLAGRNVLL